MSNDSKEAVSGSDFPKTDSKQMISQQASSTIATGSLVHSGNFLLAMNAKQVSSQTWIVDSGASDHMTGDSSVFKTFSPCVDNLNVRIADGTLSKVTGIGSVAVTKDLVLKSVLFVPKLNCNLLSVSKLTQEQQCTANFSPYACIF